MPRVASLKRKADILLTEKYSRRLVTCSFDEIFINQPPGLLAAVSSHINSENPSNKKSAFPQLPDWVKNPPPLIRPIPVNSSGFDGPVPLPFSFSWQRFIPCEGPDGTVQLLSNEEPDVLLIILQDKILELVGNEIEVKRFMDIIRSLPPKRSVSLILFAPRIPPVKEHAFLDLLTRLQFEANLTGIQQASTVQNLAVLIANFTKAISYRPFRQSRLDNRNGFSFLPASASTVSGAVAAPRFPLAGNRKAVIGNTEEVIRAWVHRTWLRQLATWRGMTGEVTCAVAEAYPTPRALFNALRDGSDDTGGRESTLTRLTKLPIRRGAGVLATETRLGGVIAARIGSFFTSDDPDFIIDGNL